MAAALAAISVIEEEKLVEKAARDGEYMLKRLRELMDKHEIIGEVDGKGLLIGMELVKDRRTKEPAVEETVKFRSELRKRGIIIGPPGWTGSRVRINPPLVITREQIDAAIEKIDESLKVIKR
jgi:4-aminobutyrate aminotransferase-like enzyme